MTDKKSKGKDKAERKTREYSRSFAALRMTISVEVSWR